MEEFRQLTTISPIDDSVYLKRAISSEQEIKAAVERSTNASKQWRQLTIEQRANYCLAMLDAFLTNKDEIAEQLTWMMGRPIRYSHNEVKGMIERAKYMIQVAPEGLKTIFSDDVRGAERFIKREPLGVVVVIAPWNYPYLTAINSIIPALMAGNTVILKHSSQTPLAAEQLAKAFDTAGLPESVFQYIHTDHAGCEFLIQQPEVSFVAFTGSVSGGKAIQQALSNRFINVGLELGGKDPAYIRADANLQHAVETVIDGAFFNSGQSCCGIERVYVANEIYDDFVNKACEFVKGYQLGRPDDPNTTLGPMVRAKSADFVRAQIEDAVAQGAVLALAPELFKCNPTLPQYLPPQLLTNVNHSMRIMTEESFGPVVGIMKVNSDEEAISLMNDSHYGLTASIFSSNINEAVAIGEQLETGTFFLNRCDYLDPSLAWVGVKDSGRGCTLSVLGYEQLTRPKSFYLKLLE